ncbi:MAG: hypothetical protein COB15_01445 [Flavobacteriales bacterium]|nr:MAG: hypothetical protein COB15_01445 [Flavobacteriales bacterium]
MNNWTEYIESLFINIEFDDVQVTETDFYHYTIFRKNGTYISFDLIEDQMKIRKVECGKYSVLSDNHSDYEISSVKGVFNKTKPHYIDYLQTSWDGECGNNYELDFGTENKTILNHFLQIPIHIGWIEEYYKYRDDYYKIELKVNVPCDYLKYKIILLHFVEQDIPLLGDRTNRLIRAWFADLKINSNNRKIEKEIVEAIESLR